MRKCKFGHSTMFYRDCPECRAIAHPPKTPREARESIARGAANARAVRTEKVRQRTATAFWEIPRMGQAVVDEIVAAMARRHP